MRIRAMDATQTMETKDNAMTCAVHRLFRCILLRPSPLASEAEREDAMTTVIPCNDYYHTVKAKKDRIIYRFVTQDSNTPSSCAIRLGDIDPMTGEAITDVELFTEYYRMVDHEVYVQGSCRLF